MSARIAAAVVLLASLPAKADADGPDFFRVVGTHGYSLNMRANGDENAGLIGAVPADATGLRNMGCKGGLSFAEYQTATPDQRRQARFKRWCLVEYKGKVGWVAGWHLAEAPGPARPSFDCARAKSNAEKLVCADPALAALDRELSALGAAAGPGACEGGGDALGVCVIDDYARRIHDVRAGLAPDARQRAGGMSLGPFIYRCEGIDDSVSAVFVRGALALASLRWGDERLVLAQARSASGARYEAAGGGIEFWIKGAEARFTRPGQPATVCRTEPTG